MRYVLAFLCPPLAVLFCGKPWRALLNLVLTLCLWIPGVVHAFLVVHAHLADRRAYRALCEMENHRLSLSLKKI